MARQNSVSTQKDKAQLLNRKTVRHQISGWEIDTPLSDDTDFVSWMKPVPGKKLNKQNSDKADEYRISLPDCPAIENLTLFHIESLHARFSKRAESPLVTKFKQRPGYLTVAPPTKKDKHETEPVSKLNCKRKALSDGDNVSTTELVDETTNMKLDLKSGNDVKNNNLEVDEKEALSRSRSVSVFRSAKSDMTRMKRLLIFARHTNANDGKDSKKMNDEDEGYVSKTSSAEEKMATAIWDPSLHITGMRSSQMDYNGAVLSSSLLMANQKYARFSYTHPNEMPHFNPNTSRLIGAGDMEPEKHNGRNFSKVHGCGHLYQYPNLPEKSSLCAEEYLRPVSLVLKEVSIQTSHSRSELGGTKTSGSSEMIAKNACETKPIETSRNVKVEDGSNTKREKYPVHNTSPELKFDIKTRMSPIKVPYKDITVSGKRSSRRSASQGFVEKHLAMPLPLSDLLPAIDRSICNSQTLRHSEVGNFNPNQLESNGHNGEDNSTLSTKEDGSGYTVHTEETKYALLKSSTDLPGRTTCRAQLQKSPLHRAKDNSELRFGDGAKLSTESPKLAPPLINKQQQHTPRMRMVTTKVKTGSETGLKLPINTERGRRKRMGTFLNFYNGKCPHQLRRALTDEINFMLNAT